MDTTQIYKEAVPYVTLMLLYNSHKAPFGKLFPKNSQECYLSENMKEFRGGKKVVKYFCRIYDVIEEVNYTCGMESSLNSDIIEAKILVQYL